MAVGRTSLNKVQLIGNVVNDIVEHRFTSQGRQKSVVNVRLATNYSYPDGQGGYREGTEFHRIACYDRMARVVLQANVQKGNKLYVEGSLRKEENTRMIDGVKHVYHGTSIIAHEVQNLTPQPR